MFSFFLMLSGVALGGLVVGFVVVLLRRSASRAPHTLTSHTIAERVRNVGKVVGLEVSAKEIATSVRGWAWLPPLLLTPARVAMIFHFDKQYWIDLSRIGPDDVEDAGVSATGMPLFRLRLPPIESALRLVDLEPYDIQAGRVLGLLDVIQMDATTQKDLIRRAQEQAASLCRTNDAQYEREAKVSIERHMNALLSLFGVEVETAWARPEPASVPAAVPGPAPAAPRLLPAPALRPAPLWQRAVVSARGAF